MRIMKIFTMQIISIKIILKETKISTYKKSFNRKMILTEKISTKMESNNFYFKVKRYFSRR